MGIKKTAKIVKRKGKWCVIGHRRMKNGEYRNFGCYNTKTEAKKRLGQIKGFKNRKAELLKTLGKVTDDLDNRGIIHIADALTGCIESIAHEELENQSVIKLGKIVCLLEKKGEKVLAETINNMLPDVLKLECVDCEVKMPKPRKRISAQRAYNVVNMLHKKYLEGMIDEDSFEFSKMKELETMLKQGFAFPKPASYESFPEDSNNWWDHFSKEVINK